MFAGKLRVAQQPPAKLSREKYRETKSSVTLGKTGMKNQIQISLLLNIG